LPKTIATTTTNSDDLSAMKSLSILPINFQLAEGTHVPGNSETTQENGFVEVPSTREGVGLGSALTAAWEEEDGGEEGEEGRGFGDGTDVGHTDGSDAVEVVDGGGEVDGPVHSCAEGLLGIGADEEQVKGLAEGGFALGQDRLGTGVLGRRVVVGVGGDGEVAADTVVVEGENDISKCGVVK